MLLLLEKALGKDSLLCPCVDVLPSLLATPWRHLLLLAQRFSPSYRPKVVDALTLQGSPSIANVPN